MNEGLTSHCAPCVSSTASRCLKQVVGSLELVAKRRSQDMTTNNLICSWIGRSGLPRRVIYVNFDELAIQPGAQRFTAVYLHTIFYKIIKL
jgi:hypothetical protein